VLLFRRGIVGEIIAFRQWLARPRVQQDKYSRHEPAGAPSMAGE
jgi:hypothetical protein